MWSTQDGVECLSHGFGRGGINHNTVEFLPTGSRLDLMEQFVDHSFFAFLPIVRVLYIVVSATGLYSYQERRIGVGSRRRR